MTLEMPPVRQVPTPNYSATPIRHDLVICHRTEGGYAGAVAWLCDRRANASAHLVMKADGSEVSQLVPLQYKAWAQCAFNSAGVSLEIEGFTAQGMSADTMRSAALIVAWLCRAYSIPPTWAQGGQGRGVCQHHDLGAAGGGHVDCFGVGSDEWQTFMKSVDAAYHASFVGDSLPPFAIHGAPGPHEIVAPPAVAAEPSHNGAVRKEIDEPKPDGTTAVAPESQRKFIQAFLNSHADAGLAVDGDIGDATVSAMVAYLIKHA